MPVLLNFILMWVFPQGYGNKSQGKMQ